MSNEVVATQVNSDVNVSLISSNVTEHVTEPTGNTRARRFQVTVFTLDRLNDIISNLKSLSRFRFGIACHEVCPDTGREHAHIYVCYDDAKWFSTIRKRTLGGHVEKCFGPHKANMSYIMKDVTDTNPILWMEGDEPHQGSSLGTDDLRSMSVVEVVESNPRLHQAYLRARELLLNGGLSLADLNGKSVEVIYIYGSSGCGKSVLAKALLRERMSEESVAFVDMVKYKNEFWTGVCYGEFAFYDEFRDSDMKPSEFISFIDYNPQRMNIKGGCTLNRYRLIVITSIQGPNELYPNMTLTEPRKQWLRRVRWINLDDVVMRKCVGIEKMIRGW